MKFNSNFERVRQGPEPGGGKSKTEKKGYIPANVRIEDMILAGKRLVEARAERFDYPAGPDDGEEEEIDPTRVRNYDLADAAQSALEIKQRMRKARKESEEMKKNYEKEKKEEKEKEISREREKKHGQELPEGA